MEKVVSSHAHPTQIRRRTSIQSVAKRKNVIHKELAHSFTIQYFIASIIHCERIVRKMMLTFIETPKGLPVLIVSSSLVRLSSHVAITSRHFNLALSFGTLLICHTNFSGSSMFAVVSYFCASSNSSVKVH